MPEEQPKVKGFDPKTSREVARRGANKVTYANSDGTKTTRYYARRVNYRRSDGTWVPIDTTLVPARRGDAQPSSPAVSVASPGGSLLRPPGRPTTGSRGWTAKAAGAAPWFASDASAPVVAELDLDEGVGVGFGIHGAEPSPGVPHGGRVDYADPATRN